MTALDLSLALVAVTFAILYVVQLHAGRSWRRAVEAWQRSHAVACNARDRWEAAAARWQSTSEQYHALWRRARDDAPAPDPRTVAALADERRERDQFKPAGLVIDGGDDDGQPLFIGDEPASFTRGDEPAAPEWPA